MHSPLPDNSLFVGRIKEMPSKGIFMLYSPPNVLKVSFIRNKIDNDESVLRFSIAVPFSYS